MKRVLTILAFTLGAVLQSCQPAFAQTSNYGGVSIAGSYTTNCIPVAVTSVTLQCSSWVDNGSSVATALPLNLTAAASTTNAIIQFNSVATTGLMFGSANQVGLKANSTTWLAVDTSSTQALNLPAGGLFGWSSSNTFGASAVDAMMGRRTTANIRFGNPDNNGAVNAQTISVQNAVTGTNLPGAAAFTFAAPLGTGNGAGSSTQFQRSIMQASGTTAQTGVAAFVVCESKTLSNTSATVQALANIALASNSAGGARGSITVTATDGTNFDSETQDFVVSYVNKATVGTVGTAAITASSAANNSGSATIGMTATFAGTTLSINATPVFTTIVPTTVTAYVELQNHGAGAVTCQ